MGTLLSLADRFARLTIFVGKLAGWIIVPLISVIMFDVITRRIEFIAEWSSQITIKYGFSVSFILQDLQWHMHGILLMMTFGFGYLMNAHVRVDIFREMASKRGQAKIEFWGLIICAVPALLMLIYYSASMTLLSWNQGEGSESMTGIPMRYIIKSFMVWGFVVALLGALATLFRCIAFLWGDFEDQAIAEDELQIFTEVDLPHIELDDDNAPVGGSAQS